jgi:hypothetical protein
MIERVTQKEGKASLSPEKSPQQPPAPQNLVPLRPAQNQQPTQQVPQQPQVPHESPDDD